MRKPAVVVAVAVSAVLAGGVMVATTAGADTHPEVPALPAAGALDVPALPALPSTTSPDDAASPPASDGSEPPATRFPHRPGGPAPASSSPAASGAATSVDPADPASPGDAAVVPAREPAVAPAQARPGGHQRPAAAAPRPQRNIAVQEKPQAQTGTLAAAAQRDVTKSQALDANPRGGVQQQALELVNQNRRRGGCGNLSVDRRLVEAANRHAADMARRGYFAHESPNGDRAGERVGDTGYEWKRFGENIARGQDSVHEVVNGWMNSPEHRENIMDCGLHEVGVGLAFAPDRTPYWVQDFATPQ